MRLFRYNFKRRLDLGPRVQFGDTSKHGARLERYTSTLTAWYNGAVLIGFATSTSCGSDYLGNAKVETDRG